MFVPTREGTELHHEIFKIRDGIRNFTVLQPLGKNLNGLPKSRIRLSEVIANFARRLLAHEIDIQIFYMRLDTNGFDTDLFEQIHGRNEIVTRDREIVS